MFASARLVTTLAAVCFLAGLTGCAAPCDRYCDRTADYIEFCLENASQGEWEAVTWATWGGYTSKDDYVGDCKADFEDQLSGSPTPDVIDSSCEDEANSYADMLERDLCAELP